MSGTLILGAAGLLVAVVVAVVAVIGLPFALRSARAADAEAQRQHDADVRAPLQLIITERDKTITDLQTDKRTLISRVDSLSDELRKSYVRRDDEREAPE